MLSMSWACFWAEDKIQKGLVKKAQDGPDLPQWRCAMTLARKGGNPHGLFWSSEHGSGQRWIVFFQSSHSF